MLRSRISRIIGLIIATLWVGLFFFVLRSLRVPGQVVDSGAPEAAAIDAVLERFHDLEGDLVCGAAVDAAVLDEVLADTRDYRLSCSEREAVAAVFGREALPGAGFATLRKAQHHRRMFPPPSTPPPGIKPTHVPVVLCLGEDDAQRVTLTAVVLYSADHAVVQYERIGGCHLTATLRRMEGRWKITAMKLLARCGA